MGEPGVDGAVIEELFRWLERVFTDPDDLYEPFPELDGRWVHIRRWSGHYIAFEKGDQAFAGRVRNRNSPGACPHWANIQRVGLYSVGRRVLRLTGFPDPISLSDRNDLTARQRSGHAADDPVRRFLISRRIKSDQEK